MKRIHDVYPETTRDGFVCFFCQAESFDFPQVWSRSFLFVLKIFKQKMVEKNGKFEANSPEN